MNRKQYFNRLLSLKSDIDFENLALKVFRFQAINNPVYSEYISRLGIKASSVKSIANIPFLPVELFKSHVVLTGNEDHEKIFTSSGTTGNDVSRHYIKDVGFYENISTNIFSTFYGNPSGYVLLALLPSYIERKGSSLVYMMEKLIAQALHPESGFYLKEFEKLFSLLMRLQDEKRKTILFGVTFGLLDFVSAYKLNFPELIVMETGGMKGMKEELIREEVHELLCNGFGVEKIHSEYGMTELMSQAYSDGKGLFKTPPWMRILIRDPYDPLRNAGINVSGGINIIDLANIDSCAFIATQDLGKVFEDNSFEVLGRFDYADMRGCNLLFQ